MSFARLYRDSCTPIKGGLTKNLAILGRDLKDILIVDVKSINKVRIQWFLFVWILQMVLK